MLATLHTRQVRQNFNISMNTNMVQNRISSSIYFAKRFLCKVCIEIGDILLLNVLRNLIGDFFYQYIKIIFNANNFILSFSILKIKYLIGSCAKVLNVLIF